jgi:kynureninase
MNDPDLERLDAADPLRECRARFHLPPGLIYLDGNSLGPLPVATPGRMSGLIEREWGEGLIRSWNAARWVDAPRRVGDKIGRLIGAQPGETLACDSTSVNLFKLLAMALQLRPGRKVILSERRNFPTDLYVAEGLAALLGAGHELRSVEPEKIVEGLDDQVAVLMLSHVNFSTGAMFDLAALTRAAHAAGALVLWDLAHSAGAVPLTLSADDADFAVGCGYKYLNGGPGAPAFLYINQRLQAAVRTPITGWFGHVRPFAFETSYAPAPGIEQAQAGTPPILGLAALECGVDELLRVPMTALREKSLRLSELLLSRVETELAGAGFEIITPRDPAQRGSQVCLRHAKAWPICQALIAQGVIGDFRAPDILRFGFAPMYLRYADVARAVAILGELMRTGGWDRPQFHQRATVT